MLSVIAHVLCVALLVLSTYEWQQKIKYGEQEEQLISSYLVVAADNNVTERNERKKPDQHAIALNTQKPAIAKNQSKQASPLRHASNKGEPMPELIALLHTAIQKAQRYPASAQEMEREGRATLSFTLHKNGTVSELTVLRSSGTSSLDNAALAAVNDAAPFQQVERYLSTPQVYQIDVVFRLS
jgi:TonB family protein